MPGPFDELEPDEPPATADAPTTDPPTTDPSAIGPATTPGAAREHASPEPHVDRRRRSDEPGAIKAFLRGATRRCPRCGGGDLFESWFRIRTRCPRCGLRLEREDGGFLGAMTVNYIVTAVVFLVVMVVWLVLDLPDVQVLRLTVAAIGVTLVFPLLFWPFSKTIWAAVDYLVYRTDPEYSSRDAADRASGNGGRP
jgi:uncharacterized protein (DUF983 family)